MRLLLELESDEEFPDWAFGKHAFQAMIYTHLTGTPYERVHDGRGFKFFCFSDVFPSGPYKPGVVKRLIVSSPDDSFIEVLYERLFPNERIYLGKHSLNLRSLKKLKLRPRRAFITGSPIVLNAPEGKGRFFTFHHFNSLAYFVDRLTENAVAKYSAFIGEPFQLDGPLFTRMVPRIRRKGWFDVYVRVNIRGRYFDVPGTNWEYLEVPRNGDRDFYTFLMDAGLGVLNSLGFGFINPVNDKQRSQRR
ncbi:CRISPR-associated endoribonuclease Cas6 [Thermococcus henrietii]|uniref:CRISPR-associated endoribonuclease Cas6 n=1 Tax=Thermococcus henrietii TaxID=2016361 RepID=UPI000C0887DD|nr:CRISPR-associated endoribonuclease Cas6 [Thermococcus henrietii]